MCQKNMARRNLKEIEYEYERRNQKFENLIRPSDLAT